ncbi:MAG: hypothetical protein K2Q14_03350 [Gammaproteobacteria bacterium]|nr:hypothetical protein [Gammaproteobacteria bacterium]
MKNTLLKKLNLTIKLSNAQKDVSENLAIFIKCIGHIVTHFNQVGSKEPRDQALLRCLSMIVNKYKYQDGNEIKIKYGEVKIDYIIRKIMHFMFRFLGRIVWRNDETIGFVKSLIREPITRGELFEAAYYVLNAFRNYPRFKSAYQSKHPLLPKITKDEIYASHMLFASKFLTTIQPFTQLKHLSLVNIGLYHGNKLQNEKLLPKLLIKIGVETDIKTQFLDLLKGLSLLEGLNLSTNQLGKISTEYGDLFTNLGIILGEKQNLRKINLSNNCFTLYQFEKFMSAFLAAREINQGNVNHTVIINFKNNLLSFPDSKLSQDFTDLMAKIAQNIASNKLEIAYEGNFLKKIADNENVISLYTDAYIDAGHENHVNIEKIEGENDDKIKNFISLVDNCDTESIINAGYLVNKNAWLVAIANQSKEEKGEHAVVFVEKVDHDRQHLLVKYELLGKDGYPQIHLVSPESFMDERKNYLFKSLRLCKPANIYKAEKKLIFAREYKLKIKEGQFQPVCREPILTLNQLSPNPSLGEHNCLTLAEALSRIMAGRSNTLFSQKKSSPRINSPSFQIRNSSNPSLLRHTLFNPKEEIIQNVTTAGDDSSQLPVQEMSTS